jgi:wyosine [tRNA(Phe)-imidazoG37] synthetase (radical SAM superfamily)
MTSPPLHAVVYGPWKKRRFGGPTLGVNPCPTLTGECPPRCSICEHGLPETIPILTRTHQRPSSGVVVTSAARKIIELSKAGEKVKTILVAGPADPTLHPNLKEITENLRDLRNKWFPKAALRLHTRGEGLDAADTRRALLIYDKPIVRFEWGTVKTFTAMTGQKGPKLQGLANNLHGVDRLILEARFVRGGPDNSTDSEVKAWIKRVVEIAPREVQIMTIRGTPAKKTGGPRPVTATRLEQISAQLSEKISGVVTLVDLEAQPAGRSR